MGAGNIEDRTTEYHDVGFWVNNVGPQREQSRNLTCVLPLETNDYSVLHALRAYRLVS